VRFIGAIMVAGLREIFPGPSRPAVRAVLRGSTG
jgi:hypothetical protein